ncbi:MAG: hypothetical protein HYR85_27655 [Planctomycetes bacterium]|nr:hypothetical protein [Planctomycetota bacterium]MBI3844243.1 hypothetical protein [Planctomycetota bacterium]
MKIVVNSLVKTIALALGVSSLSLLSIALDTPRVGAPSEDNGDWRAVHLAPADLVGTVALAGIRPIAVNALWVRSMEAFRQKDWTEALAIYRAIAFLQPRLDEAWLLNGWNLAYNLSADFAARGRAREATASVLDGIDFLREGARRNPDSAELRSYEAWVLYDRGRSDDVASALRARGEEPLDAAISAARDAATLDSTGLAAYWLAFYLSQRAADASRGAGAFADLDEALRALDRVTGPLADRARERRAEIEALRNRLENRP